MTNYTAVPLTQGDIKELLDASFVRIATLKGLKAYKKLYDAYTGKKGGNDVLHPDLVYKPELPDRIERLCRDLDLHYELHNAISYMGWPIGHTVIRGNRTYFHVDYPLLRSDTEFRDVVNAFLSKCTRIKTVILSPDEVGRGLPNGYFGTAVYVF